MKNLVFIYCGFELTHAYDKLFSSVSAFERVLLWTKEMPDCEKIKILCDEKNISSVKQGLENQNIKNADIIEKSCWNTQILLETMAKECEKNRAEYAIYTAGDKPFLDIELSCQIIADHKKYLAEYTFADGYPEGFAPQVISNGTLCILSNLAKEKKEQGEQKVTSQSIFNVIKTDVNAFEIESVIAPEDFRMARLDFSCSNKLQTLSCKHLYEIALSSKTPFTAYELTKLALKNAAVQQTVPAFYNIQISARSTSIATYNPKFPFAEDSNPYMSLEHFKALVKQISDLSEEAVVSLSAFGDPFTNENLLQFIEAVLKYEKLSLLIETDGHLITEEYAKKIKAVLDKYPDNLKSASSLEQLKHRINFIVYLDAFSEEKYFQLHKECAADSFEKSKNALNVLEELFEGAVYVQFTRVTENEDELEKFYRFYHQKESPVKGRLIIQKYDDFCKKLPPKKCADLSPLERNVCWHLKRDVTVLKDGSVPVCREMFSEKKLGNVFEEGLEAVWGKCRELVQNQIEKKYCELCGVCDEYYTFNF